MLSCIHVQGSDAHVVFSCPNGTFLRPYSTTLYFPDPLSPPSVGPTLDDINSVIQETEHPSPTSTPQFGSHDMTSCSPQAPIYPSHSTDVTDGADDTTATKSKL